MRRKKGTEEHDNLERWLITYADLITLLLAFFIMMYTFSKNDTQRYQELTGQLKTIFTGGSSVAAQGNTVGKVPFDISVKAPGSNGDVKDKLEEEIDKINKNESPQNNISIVNDERGIVIRVMDQTFFDQGKADLKDKARQTLDTIAPVIKSISNHIRVEGHTDNTPIATAEFRSNWELSVRRATEVVRYFIEKRGLEPSRVSAAGYAEYRPLAPNDTAENKSRNRRIEIIVLKSILDEENKK